MAYKVLVTDKINSIAVKILEEACEVEYREKLSADELKAIIKDFDALMIRSASKVTKEIIEAAPRLKVVGRAGVGVDNVDLEEATKHGIIVINSPEGNTVAAAEHTIALMLSMSRHIPQADLSMKNRKWDRSKYEGTEVFNKTLGLIGLGKIGSRVAKTAVALGMDVLVYDPFITEEQVKQLGAKHTKNLNDVWPVADIITLHLPKTKDTINLINKDTIHKMKKGVKLINCARGGIINEADLAEAIKEGYVASAAIDVYDKEPVENTPLLDLGDKIILTPHLGASTKEAQINVAVDVAEQIRDIAKGGSARSAVNIPALKAELLEPVKHYMQIAENLGTIVREVTKGATKSIEIIACGELAHVDISPLVIAVAKGVLSCSKEGVNYVNAPLITKNLGITTKQSKSDDSANYLDMLKVVLTTDEDSNIAIGTMLAMNIPRILRINGYFLNIEPGKHMLLCPHHDKPGMIAKVANLCGEENINISSMQVGRREREQGSIESIMVMTVDEPVSEQTIEKLKALDGIYNAKYIKLNA